MVFGMPESMGCAAGHRWAMRRRSLIESDIKTVGSFACSDDLLNRIYNLNLWTLRCLDLGGYLVDCPHRERLGYGDGQVSAESCLVNFWMPNFYAKWLADWRHGRTQNRRVAS